MPGPKRQPIEERFAAYLVKTSDDECWGWTGPVTNSGHPTLGRGGKGAGQTSARIVAYRIMTGAVPEREVLNTCDCKLCLNPRHLILAGEKSKATLRTRFEARVEKAGPDDCWLWKQKPCVATPLRTLSVPDRGAFKYVLSLRASLRVFHLAPRPRPRST